jgi:hypothetical protein
MSGYIGTQPVPQATQTRDAFTATNNQTSFPTSGYTPEFLDVFLNGVKLAAADYTATNGSDVVLAAGATTGDILEVVSYGTFEVLNPTFDGNVTFTGNASFGDNDKAIFGDGSDLQIYHDGSSSIIKDAGTGNLIIQATELQITNAGNTANYIRAFSGGAVNLYHNNSGKLSTESYGINVTGTVTATADFKAHSSSSGDYVRMYGGSGTGKWDIYGNGANLRIGDNENAGAVQFDTNVGIGTSSPAGALHTNSSGHTRTYITSGTSSDAQLNFGDSDDNDIGGIHYDNAQNSMKFLTNTSERMRIDSSGNLLVGKTTSAGYTNGIELRPYGLLTSSRDGAASLLLNRTTNDGDIISLAKDGTTVGSIGVHSSGTYLGTADTGIYFNGGNDSIDPYNPSVPINRDNAISLGAGSRRFKDLYLSGGVVFDAVSGNATSNTLDDYEEGTFTPAVSGATANTAGGNYIKIGNFVYVKFRFDWQGLSGSTAQLSGLPFGASPSGQHESMGFNVYANAGFGNPPTNKGYLNAYAQGISLFFTWQPNSVGANFNSSGNIYVTGVYNNA